MWQKIRVNVNNLGWISRFDYARHKRPSEYRIAIIGSSMTASVTNENPWPDLVQERLNSDAELLTAIKAKEITVLNLGRAGANMRVMANKIAVIAMAFDPDMVVVNFSMENVVGDIGGPIRFLTNLPDKKDALDNLGRTFSSMMGPHYLKVGSAELHLACKKPPFDASNPTCRTSPIWFVQSSDIKFEKEDLNDIKREAAQLMLWHRVIMTLKPLSLMDLFGKPAVQGLKEVRSNNDAGDIEVGTKALQAINLMHDEMVATYNPLYRHLVKQQSQDRLVKFINATKKVGIDIHRMEDYMPVQRGEQEWYRWYLRPHDEHWSDYGAEVYSDAIYRVIRTRLLKSANIDAKPSNCAKAFSAFKQGQEARSRGHLDVAMSAYERSLESIPFEFQNTNYHDTTFHECGFVSRTHLEIARIAGELGHVERMLSAWEASLKINKDQSAIYKERAKIRDEQGDLAGALRDYDELVRIQTDDAVSYYFRGVARSKLNDNWGAIEDFTAGLEISPSYVTLLVLRGNHFLKEKRLDQAIADYSAAINIKQDLLSAYSGRARLYTSGAICSGTLGLFCGVGDQ